MLKFVGRRLLLFPLLLVAANAIGYGVAAYLGLKSRSIFGAVELSDVWAAYGGYLQTALRGDFGTLPATGTSIATFVAGALPKTLLLVALALIFSAIVGVTIGLMSVNRKKKQTNALALTLSLGGFSMPSFYLGIVAIYVMLQLSAASGRHGTLLPAAGFGIDEHLILPVLVLAARPTSEVARLTSELISEELHKEYIRAARAKGLPWRLVMIRHAFRNVMASIVVTLGASMQYVVSSLIVVEAMFSWPGLGEALTNTLTGRMGNQWLLDPNLTAALMTMLALLFLLANLITDLSARAIDPRLAR